MGGEKGKREEKKEADGRRGDEMKRDVGAGKRLYGERDTAEWGRRSR